MCNVLFNFMAKEGPAYNERRTFIVWLDILWRYQDFCRPYSVPPFTPCVVEGLIPLCEFRVIDTCWELSFRGIVFSGNCFSGNWRALTLCYPVSIQFNRVEFALFQCALRFAIEALYEYKYLDNTDVYSIQKRNSISTKSKIYSKALSPQTH